MSAVTRRSMLVGSCAATLLAAAQAQAGDLSLDPFHPGLVRAPRFDCPHPLCRHHRPDPDGGAGICSLALSGPVAYPFEVLP